MCDSATSRVRSVSAAAMASRVGSTSRITTPCRCASSSSGAVRPGCSCVVVMTSSPAAQSMPQMTVLQPSVVQWLSAISSGGAPAASAKPVRARSVSPSQAAYPRAPTRPQTYASSRCWRMASTAGLGTGPNVPALK